MHIITFIIPYRLFTFTCWIIVCYHRCVHRLEFWKLRVVYFATGPFRHRTIGRFWFWCLFVTLRLHFRFCYYTHFVPRLFRSFYGHILLIVLLYVILHFFITIGRLVDIELPTYYFLVTGWVLVCEDGLHFYIFRFLWRNLLNLWL